MTRDNFTQSEQVCTLCAVAPDRARGARSGWRGRRDVHSGARPTARAGDTVVVLGDLVGKGANGDFDTPFVHAWTFRDGKATSFNEAFDTVKINQAIG